ncbi:adenylate/guanylate cyclase domain-containing protein [Thermodesulfobacteriota bacterium]
MNCPSCRFQNPEGMKFCGECGAKLEPICPKCGATNPPQFNFCGECGLDLRRSGIVTPVEYAHPKSYTPKFLADKILTSRSTVEGERKVVTVLFADVAEYTSMAEKLDPEEVHQIMDGCFRILMDEIHNYEGTVNQFTGDGVMALFGAPVAHEDHAQRACHAAMSIQKALVKYSEKLKRDLGIEFKMRIGLNSGPVIVGAIGDDLRMDYTAVGDTTNLAARIQQVAAAGEVWVSPQTIRINKDYFQHELVGELALKGKAEPQPVHRVIAERLGVRTRFDAGLARGITKLVGRHSEMETLLASFDKATRGKAQVVDLVGEAGVGKTRLVYEFEKRLDGKATFISATCRDHCRNVGFFAVIDMVRSVFGVKEGMKEEEAGTRIEQKVAPNLGPMIGFYRNLLSLTVDDPKFRSLDPEGRKFGTFEAVKDLLFELSKRKPLVVFLEDVHWMDKLSHEFFSYFSRCLLDHRIVLLAAYRPEGKCLGDHGSNYQKMILDTLNSEFSTEHLRNILFGLTLDPANEQAIVMRTGGNPFFVEETVRALVDRGDLTMAQSSYVLSRPIDHFEIPNTVQGILAARMDRLSDDLKKTMQTASIIGRDFSFRLLREVMGAGDELRTQLEDLVAFGILHENSIFPDLEYLFKHSLTQEVAYGTLLKQRRREIHGRIARTIEEFEENRIEEHYEVLAHHYERSGNTTKAIDYFLLSGEKSIKQGAVQSAGEFFHKAAEQAETSDTELDARTLVRLHRGQAQAGLGIGDIGKAEKGFRRAIQLTIDHGMIDHEMKILPQLAMIMHMWPDSSEAERTLEDLVARADEVGDESVKILILNVMAFRTAHLGRPHEGNLMWADIQRTAMDTGNHEVIFQTRVNRSFTERWLGRPRKAIELTEGAVELLRARHSRDYLSEVIFNRSISLAEVGRIDEGMALLKHEIDTCEKLGISNRIATLYNALGYCYSEIHQHQKAWTLNTRSEQLAQDLLDQYPMGRPQHAEVVAHARVNLMENLFAQGKVDEAWNRLESLKEDLERPEYSMLSNRWESRMNYLAAQILLHRNDFGQAETFIWENLQEEREKHTKKREGGFLRLLGEVQIRSGKADMALNNLHEAILVLRKVDNPRQLWQAYASHAKALSQLGRFTEAREQWGAASAVIQDAANRLADRQLREGFLNTGEIRQILSRTDF